MTKGIGIALAAVAGALMLLPATAAAQTTVNARGTIWDPDEIEVALNDEVTWRFDHPDNTLPHDVWLAGPGDNPAPPEQGGDLFQVSPVVPAGSPPVSRTLDELGNWIYVCRVHSGFSGGQWTGMVGTADVSEGGGGDPALSLRAQPQRDTVKPGKRATFAANLRNAGAAAANQVRICAKAPRRLVTITGNACRSTASLGVGRSIAPRFTIRPKPKARGKSVRISFTATAANAPREAAAATLKVTRR